jgi:hypothetical protein
MNGRSAGCAALFLLATGRILNGVEAECCSEVEQAHNTLTAAERAEGWQLLFDGQTTQGWRGFRRPDMPTGWRVVDGELQRAGSGGDIITVEQFADFELKLEWKIEKGGNSGVIFRVSEEWNRTWKTGPEMQVLDDERHRDGLQRITSAGSNYALHAAPEGAVHPAETWNHARIVARGAHVEHWLNGVKVVEYELWSPEWEELVAASKWDTLPGYGRQRRGHIALQDHGDSVAYRNIKIRPLR